MTYTEIDRSAVPAFSFRYGQLASNDGFDVPDNAWAVCTDCTHFDENETMSEVLVGHFLFSNEQEARDTAERLGASKHVGPITLVRPK